MKNSYWKGIEEIKRNIPKKSTYTDKDLPKKKHNENNKDTHKNSNKSTKSSKNTKSTKSSKKSKSKSKPKSKAIKTEQPTHSKPTTTEKTNKSKQDKSELIIEKDSPNKLDTKGTERESLMSENEKNEEKTENMDVEKSFNNSPDKLDKLNEINTVVSNPGNTGSKSSNKKSKQSKTPKPAQNPKNSNSKEKTIQGNKNEKTEPEGTNLTKPTTISNINSFSQPIANNNQSKKDKSYLKNKPNEQNSDKNSSFVIKKEIAERDFLPCRESEQSEIYNHIKNGLKAEGGYPCLFISGMPGTGKTECVKNIISILKKERDSHYIKPFNILEINAMKIANSSAILKIFYSFLFKSDGKKDLIVNKCAGLIDDYFNGLGLDGGLELNDPSRPHIIVLIDEIDALLNGKQPELFNIMNWAFYSTSKLIVITISNVLDLPEQFVSKSNFNENHTKLMFQPYRHEQLLKILKHRLTNKGVNQNNQNNSTDKTNGITTNTNNSNNIIYSEDAIAFCCKKVANLNGDLRRIFQTLKQAEQIFYKSKPNPGDKINLITVLQAYKELFDSKTINLLKNLQICEKIVLLSVLYEVNSAGNGKANVLKIYNKQLYFIPKVNKNIKEVKSENEVLEPISFDSFQQIIYNLVRIGVLKFAEMNTFNFQEYSISPRFYTEEFMQAMTEDNIIGDIAKDFAE